MENEFTENELVKGRNAWFGFLGTVMKLPGVKIDRRSFLSKELRNYCNNDALRYALDNGTVRAKIPLEVLDRIASGVIRYHSTLAVGTSFATGLPGGWAIIGTIPADLAQFYFHVFHVCQKLAYVYGWPDLDENGANDEFLNMITLFVGIMSGVTGVNTLIAQLSKMLSETAGKKIAGIALTKTAIYPVIKKIASWLGVALTKQTFARGVSKFIPLLGGLISAGVTAATFIPMANRLKKVLRENPIN